METNIYDEKTWRSPFTGGKIKHVVETRKVKYRGEEFKYKYEYFLCLDTKFRFQKVYPHGHHRDDEFQAEIEYRKAHDIPFDFEFKRRRKRYGLTTEQMTKILHLRKDAGWGVNEYEAYEQGYVPEAKDIERVKAVNNSIQFLLLVEEHRELVSDEEYEDIKAVVERDIEREAHEVKYLMLEERKGEGKGSLYEVEVDLRTATMMTPYDYSEEKYSLKNAKLCTREAQVTIYGRTYPYTEHYYVDIPTGKEYYTEEVYDINENQYHIAYRKDRGIPLAEELKVFREKLGVTSEQMTMIVGLDPYDDEYGIMERGRCHWIPSLEYMLWLAEAMKNPNLLYPFEKSGHFWDYGKEHFFTDEQFNALKHRLEELIEEYNNSHK